MWSRNSKSGRAEVENQYGAFGEAGGQPCPRSSHRARCSRWFRGKWRGIGEIPASGLRLREAYRERSTRNEFPAWALARWRNRPNASARLVLQGLKKPLECPAFGTRCTPETPLGAPMVSSEGACAAYYLYGRHKHERSESELPRTASRG